MTKSELINQLAAKLLPLPLKDADTAVKILIEQMTLALESGQRIEIRGFGSFMLRYREPRVGRNPRTGDPVTLQSKYVPRFKAGKEMRERVNDSLLAGKVIQNNAGDENDE